MECSIFAHLKANVSAKLNEWKQDLECEGSSECSITPTEISVSKKTVLSLFVNKL